MFNLKKMAEAWVNEHLKVKGFDESGAIVLTTDDPSIYKAVRNKWRAEGGSEDDSIRIVLIKD